MTEVKHDLSQLPDTFLHGHELPVDHVDAVGGRIDHVLLDEASEAGEVGGDGGNAPAADTTVKAENTCMVCTLPIATSVSTGNHINYIFLSNLKKNQTLLTPRLI